MSLVKREELLDYQTWTDRKREALPRILAEKARRRIGVGECFTFLFENRETVGYQIQEMMRVERMVREAEIRHELDTYNELLGGPGGLGCSLLIEIDDPARRDVRLREWTTLPGKTYMKLPDGRKVYATFDPRQIGGDRLSSVQFLKFAVGGVTPVGVGIDLPGAAAYTPLSEDQMKALQEDLADSSR